MEPTYESWQKEILVFVSGDDLRNLLNSVLEEIDHNQNIRTREHSALIGIISNLNLRIKPKCKHFYLKELRIAGFSKSEVKKLGFKFSDWLWEKWLDSTNRNLGGRPSIGNWMANSITNHLENFSEIAGSRTTTEFKKAIKNRKPNGTIYAIPGTSEKIIENSRFMKISIVNAYINVSKIFKIKRENVEYSPKLHV